MSASASLRDRPANAVLVHAVELSRLTPRAAEQWPTFQYWAPPQAGGLGPGDFPRVRVMLTTGLHTVDGELMDRFPGLRLIAGFASGYNGIDLEAATKRGIAVSRVSVSLDRDMADWALGALIVLFRDMLRNDRYVRSGQWKGDWWPPLVPSLSSRTVGIIGLGGIGKAVADGCAALGMRVVWWGPREKPSPYQRMPDVKALAEISDAVVVACALNDETRRLIDTEILRAIGKDGFLVNVARGPVVDELALIDALRNGVLAGAALDVFDPEPTQPERWLDLPNVLLSPHRAGATEQRVAASIERLFENVNSHFANRPIPDRIV